MRISCGRDRGKSLDIEKELIIKSIHLKKDFLKTQENLVKGVSILFQQLVNTMPFISYSNIAQYGGMYASALRRV